jgi:hypothetical protein
MPTTRNRLNLRSNEKRWKLFTHAAFKKPKSRHHPFSPFLHHHPITRRLAHQLHSSAIYLVIPTRIRTVTLRMRTVTISPNPVSVSYLRLKQCTDFFFTAKKRRVAPSSANVSIVSDDDGDDEDEEDREFAASKKTRRSLGNPMDVDSDGLLVDVDVQPIDDSRQSREDKRRDINEFFHPAVAKDIQGIAKKYSTCKLCP